MDALHNGVNLKGRLGDDDLRVQEGPDGVQDRSHVRQRVGVLDHGEANKSRRGRT